MRVGGTGPTSFTAPVSAQGRTKEERSKVNMYTYYDVNDSDKPFRCSGCGGHIEKGETYKYCDGFLFCLGCLEADEETDEYVERRRLGDVPPRGELL